MNAQSHLKFYNRVLSTSEHIEDIHSIVSKYLRDMVYTAPEYQDSRFVSNVIKVRTMAQALLVKNEHVETCNLLINECNDILNEYKTINQTK